VVTPYTHIAYTTNTEMSALAVTLGLPLDKIEGDFIAASDGSLDSSKARAIANHYVESLSHDTPASVESMAEMISDLEDITLQSRCPYVCSNTYDIVDTIDGFKLIDKAINYYHFFEDWGDQVQVYSLDNGAKLPNAERDSKTGVLNNETALAFTINSIGHPKYLDRQDIPMWGEPGYENTLIAEDTSLVDPTPSEIRFTYKLNGQKVTFDKPVFGIKSLKIIYAKSALKCINYEYPDGLFYHTYAIAISDTGALYWFDTPHDRAAPVSGAGIIQETTKILCDSSMPGDYALLYDFNGSKGVTNYGIGHASLDPTVSYKGISYEEYGFSAHQVYANRLYPNYIRFRDEFFDDFGSTITCGDRGGFGFVAGDNGFANTDIDFMLLADISNPTLYTGVAVPASCKGPVGMQVNHYMISAKNPELISKLKKKISSQ